MDDKNQRPEWLDEIEALANDQLGEIEDGSACKQIHPIVEHWYEDLMEGDPPESRDSVMQAIACLSTEILLDMPEEVFETLLEGEVDQLEIAFWIQEILTIGRAFQMALDKGELDDL
jgi:hypothetical protein